MTRQRYNLEVWTLAQSRRDDWVPLTRYTRKDIKRVYTLFLNNFVYFNAFSRCDCRFHTLWFDCFSISAGLTRMLTLVVVKPLLFPKTYFSPPNSKSWQRVRVRLYIDCKIYWSKLNILCLWFVACTVKNKNL